MLEIGNKYKLVQEVEVNQSGGSSLSFFSGEEPFFSGMLPGIPLLPGPISLDVFSQSMAQIAGREMGSVPYIQSVQFARFRRPVSPPCEMTVTVTLHDVDTDRRLIDATCQAEVAGEMASKARLSVQMVTDDDIPSDRGMAHRDLEGRFPPPDSLISMDNPFVFVTEITAVDFATLCSEGYWNVPLEAWFLEDHFVGVPVLPPGILIESLGQSMSAAVLASLDVPRGNLGVLASLRNVQIHQMVRPGELLIFKTNTSQVLPGEPASFRVAGEMTDRSGAPVISLSMTVFVGPIDGFEGSLRSFADFGLPMLGDMG